MRWISTGLTRRLTHEVGYDGGAFFSRQPADRLSLPSRNQEELDRYKGCWRKAWWNRSRLEIFIMNADDGSGKRQSDDQ